MISNTVYDLGSEKVQAIDATYEDVCMWTQEYVKFMPCIKLLYCSLYIRNYKCVSELKWTFWSKNYN